MPSRLHNEIEAFVVLVSETDAALRRKEAAAAELLLLAQRLWGHDVSIGQHGSTATGTALRGSDLDVIIGGLPGIPEPDGPGGNGYLPNSRPLVAGQLEALRRLIDTETELCDNTSIVATARMPVLHLFLRRGGPVVKVTLTPLPAAQAPALRTAAAMTALAQGLPVVKPMLLLLKALMRPSCCLSSVVGVHAGGISSFTVTLMVLAFCKFQAHETKPRPGGPISDLGHLFVTLLRFYATPQHFDVTSHAIDITTPSGFVSKDEAQAGLDATARLEVSERLCVLEPILRHDIGTGTFRSKEVLAALGSVRQQLMSKDALQAMSAEAANALWVGVQPRSFARSTQPSQDTLPCSARWLSEHMYLLYNLTNPSSLLPLAPDTLPRDLDHPRAHRASAPVVSGGQSGSSASAGSFFMPGMGPMTLGQVSSLSHASHAAKRGVPVETMTRGAYPTLQEAQGGGGGGRGGASADRDARRRMAAAAQAQQVQAARAAWKAGGTPPSKTPDESPGDTATGLSECVATTTAATTTATAVTIGTEEESTVPGLASWATTNDSPTLHPIDNRLRRSKSTGSLGIDPAHATSTSTSTAVMSSSPALAATEYTLAHGPWAGQPRPQTEPCITTTINVLISSQQQQQQHTATRFVPGQGGQQQPRRSLSEPLLPSAVRSRATPSVSEDDAATTGARGNPSLGLPDESGPKNVVGVPVIGIPEGARGGPRTDPGPGSRASRRQQQSGTRGGRGNSGGRFGGRGSGRGPAWARAGSRSFPDNYPVRSHHGSHRGDMGRDDRKGRRHTGGSGSMAGGHPGGSPQPGGGAPWHPASAYAAVGLGNDGSPSVLAPVHALRSAPPGYAPADLAPHHHHHSLPYAPTGYDLQPKLHHHDPQAPILVMPYPHPHSAGAARSPGTWVPTVAVPGQGPAGSPAQPSPVYLTAGGAVVPPNQALYSLAPGQSPPQLQTHPQAAQAVGPAHHQMRQGLTGHSPYGGPLMVVVPAQFMYSNSPHHQQHAHLAAMHGQHTAAAQHAVHAAQVHQQAAITAAHQQHAAQQHSMHGMPPGGGAAGGGPMMDARGYGAHHDNVTAVLGKHLAPRHSGGRKGPNSMHHERSGGGYRGAGGRRGGQGSKTTSSHHDPMRATSGGPRSGSGASAVPHAAAYGADTAAAPAASAAPQATPIAAAQPQPAKAVNLPQDDE